MELIILICSLTANNGSDKTIEIIKSVNGAGSGLIDIESDGNDINIGLTNVVMMLWQNINIGTGAAAEQYNG